MNPTVYPWFESQWLAFAKMANTSRLGHAIMLSGRPGSGLAELSYALAKQLLCELESDETAACGECRACLLFAAGTHPDFKVLEPTEEGKAIVVDQVRALNDYYALKPHYDRGKLTVIYPANRLNRAAANALLKVLEEPPNGATILLVTENFSAMPMTIRSRCVRFACDHLDPKIVGAWLQQERPNLDAAGIARALNDAGGAPILALTLSDETEVAAVDALLQAIERMASGQAQALVESRQFAKIPLQRLMQMQISTISNLILAKFGANSYYDPPGSATALGFQELANRLDLKSLYVFLDLLFETKSLLSRHAGFRDIDITESLWLGLAKAVDRSVSTEL